MKKLESHHASGVGEHEEIRAAQKHLAMVLADLKLRAHTVAVLIDTRTNFGKPRLLNAIHPMDPRQFPHLRRPIFQSYDRKIASLRKICAQCCSSSGGLCGSTETEADMRCFCPREMGARALSDGLDTPNAFAI
jgi:hypothetical protein